MGATRVGLLCLALAVCSAGPATASDPGTSAQPAAASDAGASAQPAAASGAGNSAQPAATSDTVSRILRALARKADDASTPAGPASATTANATTSAATSSAAAPGAAPDASAQAYDWDAGSEDADAIRRKPIGLMLDLGSMNGAMLSLLYRPVPWLRLHAGAGTNAVSVGYRAGLTIAKPGGGPSLNIEGGHFLPGDMNGLLKILVGTSYEQNSRLEHFDYDFINLHAGWEIESGNLIFFARGGVSVLWTRIPALAQADPFRTEESSSANAAAASTTEPFDLVLPSLAIGFVGFL